MSFISYAQNFEDVMLWRALKDVENGFYIDVGANDPVTDSVTKAFYDRSWRGINIEPLESHWRDLNTDRPEDINLQCAASNITGEVEIWEPEVRGWATASRKTIQKHQNGGYGGRLYAVPSKTLAAICSEYVTGDIHFLKIDVEGLEKQVLEGMDFSAFRPWIVVVEATVPDTTIENYKEWEPILKSNDYSMIYADGLNRFYVAKEHRKLRNALKYPPNVFDDFITSPLTDALAWREQTRIELDQARYDLKQTAARLLETEDKARQYAGQAASKNIRLQQLQSELRQAQNDSLHIHRQLQQERNRSMKSDRRATQAEAEASRNAAWIVSERAQLQAVQATLSWRITRPLRGVRRIFKGDFEPLRTMTNAMKRRLSVSQPSVDHITGAKHSEQSVDNEVVLSPRARVLYFSLIQAIDIAQREEAD